MSPCLEKLKQGLKTRAEKMALLSARAAVPLSEDSGSIREPTWLLTAVSNVLFLVSYAVDAGYRHTQRENTTHYPS